MPAYFLRTRLRISASDAESLERRWALAEIRFEINSNVPLILNIHLLSCNLSGGIQSRRHKLVYVSLQPSSKILIHSFS